MGETEGECKSGVAKPKIRPFYMFYMILE